MVVSTGQRRAGRRAIRGLRYKWELVIIVVRGTSSFSGRAELLLAPDAEQHEGRSLSN